MIGKMINVQQYIHYDTANEDKPSLRLSIGTYIIHFFEYSRHLRGPGGGRYTSSIETHIIHFEYSVYLSVRVSVL